MPDESLIEASQLVAGYDGKAAISGVTLSLHGGERMALLGPNGGGKTTLLRTILGELAPLRGELRVAVRCATVPQTERSQLDYPVSALDVAAMGALSRLPWWRRPGRRDREVARRALDRVGLADRAGATFGKLSGGQRQRVLIARSLIQEARVLLLDEPFSGLDTPSSERLEGLILALAAEGHAVMIATHDLEQARRWDSVLCLNHRQVACGPPDQVLDLGVIEETYGGAVVELPGGEGKAVLPPAPPSPLMFEPFQDEFMRRAIAEMTLLGVAGGALGCWVVLYRLSYAAESLAHSIFPGLVLATLAGVPLLIGAGPAIALAALAIVLISRVPGISREVAVGLVVTTLFGLGVLLALSPDSPPGLQGILFGDILGPSDGDLIAAAVLAATVLAGLFLFHARLLAVGFDPGTARALGVRPAAIEAVLMVLLAAAIVVAVQGLGNLLVAAVFVGPAAAARELTDRALPMIAAAVGLAVLAGIAGLYCSYFLGTAGGASVALAILATYLLTAVAARLGALAFPSRGGAEATIV